MVDLGQCTKTITAVAKEKNKQTQITFVAGNQSIIQSIKSNEKTSQSTLHNQRTKRPLKRRCDSSQEKKNNRSRLQKAVIYLCLVGVKSLGGLEFIMAHPSNCIKT